MQPFRISNDFKKAMAHRALVISVILLGIFGSRECYAQALDPNCWKPTVGNGIETFEKSNITHPSFGYPPKRLPAPFGDSTHYYIGMDSDTLPYMNKYISTIPFSFSSLQFQKKLQINLGIDYLVFGHFHSPKLLDLLISGNSGPPFPSHFGVGTIYWADSNGDYDTTRFTVLRSTVHGDYGPGFKGGGLYYAHLTTDTLDDLLFLGFTDWSANSPDSPYKAFLILFQANGNISHSDTLAYNDSSIYWGPVFDSTGSIQIFSRSSTTADFRGVGRKDWLGNDYKNNVFYYRNDPPFSMQKFYNASHFDTILAAWQNPKLENISSNNQPSNILTLPALPRNKEDTSVDFVPSFLTYNHYLENSFWIFRGGRDFGTKRLSIDSSSSPPDSFQHAEFIIRNPALFDGSFSGISFGGNGVNAGDITGTGRPVLRTSAGYDFGTGYDIYYVLGNAIDEKIDIIVSYPVGAGGTPIPIDADGDKYGDVLYQQFSNYPNGSLTPDSSGLWILHGSPKIPVHLNPKYSVPATNSSPENIEIIAFPNPSDAGASINLTFMKSGDYTLTVWDMLGRKFDSKNYFFEQGSTSLSLSTKNLINGTYVIRVSGEGQDKSVKVLVHH